LYQTRRGDMFAIGGGMGSKRPDNAECALVSRPPVIGAPHEVSIDGEHVYSLGEVIDIAEENSPTTQATWNRAKMTTASVGIAKGEIYLIFVATASGRMFLRSQLFYQTIVLQDWAIVNTKSYLAYTLVDFGARCTESSTAQARLAAPNLSFNNEHPDLIRQVS
jgi:outer membrane protein